MKKLPVHTTVCATGLRKFTEAEATRKPSKFFTDNKPFSDGAQVDALLNEAKLLLRFAEEVSAVAEASEGTCPESASTIFALITLLSEEAQHRISEVNLIREQRATMKAEATSRKEG